MVSLEHSGFIQLPPEAFEPAEPREKLGETHFAVDADSLERNAWKRFWGRWMNRICVGVIAFLILMSVIGPGIAFRGYTYQDLHCKDLPPRIPILENFGICDGSRIVNVQEDQLEEYAFCLIRKVGTTTTAFSSDELVQIRINAYVYQGVEDCYFWFGTDGLGRDLFARVWMGARTSLTLALAVTALNLSIGLLVGAVCGYYGGWTDLLISRITDIFQNIPSLPLTVVLVLMFGSSLRSLIFIFGLTGWIGTASSVRMQFYRYRSREYVLAARTMGLDDRHIMTRHILPNAVGTIITQNILTLPQVIFLEAGLAYLGLAISEPGLSIGTLLAQGQENLISYPYLLAAPSTFLVAMMLAFHILGNGLRDAFNPALRG